MPMFDRPEPRRDEDDAEPAREECACRSSATCAPCLERADLMLRHVPMGGQARGS